MTLCGSALVLLFSVSIATCSLESPELSWVKYTKDGATAAQRATSAERSLFENYYSGVNPEAGGGSVASKAMEDGPFMKVEGEPAESAEEVGNSEENLLRLAKHKLTGQYLEQISDRDMYYYPAFAIGILENGCSAFLIGPRYALTSAHCVFSQDTMQWGEHLDLWRGQDMSNYISKMEWESVVIASSFYTNESQQADWAMITYTTDTQSPVWLKIATTPNVERIIATLYGYLHEDLPQKMMFSTICKSSSQQEEEHYISVSCSTDLRFNPGGPAFHGYDFTRKYIPYVYGINLSPQYSYEKKLLRFDSKLFWFLCYSMAEDGPQCKEIA